MHRHSLSAKAGDATDEGTFALIEKKKQKGENKNPYLSSLLKRVKFEQEKSK